MLLLLLCRGRRLQETDYVKVEIAPGRTFDLSFVPGTIVIHFMELTYETIYKSLIPISQHLKSLSYFIVVRDGNYRIIHASSIKNMQNFSNIYIISEFSDIIFGLFEGGQFQQKVSENGVPPITFPCNFRKTNGWCKGAHHFQTPLGPHETSVAKIAENHHFGEEDRPYENELFGK